MSEYLSLRLYKKLGGINTDTEVNELITSVLKESGMLGETEGEEEYSKKPYRVMTVLLDDGKVTIRDKEEGNEKERELAEQLSNEFLIQVEMQNIRKWDPMRYSRAYGPEEEIAWDLSYAGLKGSPISLHAEGSYPKNWQVLYDIIEAFGSESEVRLDSAHLAARYYDELKGTSSSCVIDNVAILSSMDMPKDVIAAAILHQASLEKDFDREKVAKEFDETVSRLLDEYKAEPGLEDDPWKLISIVKKSDSLYFKRVVLAEVLADLIAIRAGDVDWQDGEALGAYYAGIIAALDVLDKDEKAGKAYRRLVDLYKEVFVTYSIDSVSGMIYQIQGTAAAVSLKRGEYDWKPTKEAVSEEAEEVHKELALFIASLWKREADEAIVRDGNKSGAYDVPDIKVLKVAIHKDATEHTKHSEKVVKSTLKRMMRENEQLLVAMRAGVRERMMIEKGGVDNVNSVPASFLGIEDESGETLAAVLTSMDERDEIDEGDITGVPVETILKFVKEMQHLDGIVIDPFSDSFRMTKEEIADLIANAENDEEKMI